MKRTLNILPLKLTAHTDRVSILNAYSRELGSVAFVVSAGSGPAAARRRALLMPLNPLEIQTTVRPGHELLTFGEPRALMPLHHVLASPARASLTMFLAEALAPIVRQGEADKILFDYILDAMERLNDPQTPVANFHLCFLAGMTSLLGIEPDATEYRPGMLFDMLDARFRQTAALHGHMLSPTESQGAERLCRITWQNQGHYHYTSEQRARALELILQFYTLHHANLSGLRSPSILHTILH